MVIEKTTRGIIVNKISEFIFSVSRNANLKIFIDENRLNIFDNIKHPFADKTSIYMFLNSKNKTREYIKISNPNLMKSNVFINKNSVNPSEKMFEHIWTSLHDNPEDYVIIASQNLIFEALVRDLNAQNTMFFHIPNRNAKFFETKSELSANDIKANMYRIFRC